MSGLISQAARHPAKLQRKYPALLTWDKEPGCIFIAAWSRSAAIVHVGEGARAGATLGAMWSEPAEGGPGCDGPEWHEWRGEVILRSPFA